MAARLVLWSSTMTMGTVAHAFLAEADAQFAVRWISLKAGDHRKPDFLGINPKGQVPALVVEAQGVLTEIPAIGAFVADAHPDAALLPKSAFARAEALSWLAWFHYRHASSFIAAFNPARIAPDASDEVRAGIRATAIQRITSEFALLEERLDGRDFVMGAGRTLPDIPIAVATRWAGRLGVEVPPRAAAHRDRVLALPGVARVFAEETALG